MPALPRRVIRRRAVHRGGAPLRHGGAARDGTAGTGSRHQDRRQAPTHRMGYGTRGPELSFTGTALRLLY